MPPVTKKPKAAAAAATDKGTVLYPEIEISGIRIPRENLKVTSAKAKTLLGWETEDAYKERLVKENPNLKINVDAGFGEDYLLEDKQGNKICCLFNLDNRPFTEAHSLTIAQDILKRKFKLNLETIIISLTGRIVSGQHRLIGLILAVQMWLKNKEKYPAWQEEPYIESLIALGGSDDPEVVRTIDNVRPRSEGDVIYTSSLFKGLAPVERKECSRMLAIANDFLWKRTGAGKTPQGVVYQTHSESLSFIERHPKLLEAVKYMFSENKERVISKLKLSAGQCAGMMYLMGSAKSDIDVYRNSEPPAEKQLDWEMWDKAKEFWTLMGTGADFSPLRDAIANLFDADAGEGLGGRNIEKVAVLCKAWALWAQGGIPDGSDLVLKYGVSEKGQLFLDEEESFGGIDLGEVKPEVKAPTQEEIEQQKLEGRERRQQELIATLNARKGTGKPAEKDPTDIAREVLASKAAKANGSNGSTPQTPQAKAPAKPTPTPAGKPVVRKK